VRRKKETYGQFVTRKAGELLDWIDWELIVDRKVGAGEAIDIMVMVKLGLEDRLGPSRPLRKREPGQHEATPAQPKPAPHMTGLVIPPAESDDDDEHREDDRSHE